MDGISVYGVNDGTKCPFFLSELEHIGNARNLPQCVGGDFNEIPYTEERNREARRTGGMEMFGDFVDGCNLLDVPISGTYFTWSNFQKDLALSKLDRFLISIILEDLFALLEVIPLARHRSNHIPLVLKGGVRR